MTNECVAACSLHLLTCFRECLCVRTWRSVCVCVFACLSHDVLWRSLTNRTGASRRWGGGGERRGLRRRRVGKRSYGALKGGILWLTAVT